jgi:cytochrome c-type biogenesis protein CcmH
MKALLLSLVIAMMADVPLDDPAEEARAQALMRELRCVACENEPVSQSAAPIAEDMRTRIREMIGEGASDQEVRDWFESRYGEFVLFRPKGRGFSGAILWGGPFLLLAAGGVIGFLTTRRRRTDAAGIEPEDA